MCWLDGHTALAEMKRTSSTTEWVASRTYHSTWSRNRDAIALRIGCNVPHSTPIMPAVFCCMPYDGIVVLVLTFDMQAVS